MAKKNSVERRSRQRCWLDPQHRILVVDDDLEHISSVSRILGKAGYEVRSESKVEHGLRAAKEERFDVVLMGYRFDNSAVTMTSVIGEFAREASAGVIMLTAFVDPTIEQDALLLGVNAFLLKPVKAAILLRAIMSLLARQGAPSMRATAPPSKASSLAF